MAVVENAFETKGTHLFFVDTTGEEPVVRKLTCPTGLTPIGAGSKDRIDTTCLDETGGYRTYIGGFADAEELSAPFILYKDDDSHQALFAMRDANATVSWFVGLSDSDEVPTLSTDDELVPPANRTGFSFTGYISSVSVSADINEVIRGALSIQPSGATTPHWATA